MYKIIYNLKLQEKLSDNREAKTSQFEDACAIANFISADSKTYNVSVYDNENNKIYVSKENGELKR